MSARTKKSLPMIPRFVISGMSGMGATALIQPFDYVRVRCQMHGMGVHGKRLGLLSGAIQVVKTSPSLLLFYEGLSAGLFRQALYTTGRLGLYFMMEDWLEKRRGGSQNVSFLDRLGMGLLCGGSSAFVFETPTVICLNRMMGDRLLPPEQQRHYRHVFDALARIVKEEGPRALWKGAIPGLYRACALNAAQLGVYSQAKQVLLRTGKFKDNIFLHIPASVVSGIACTVSSLPFDLVRTRVQMDAEAGLRASVPREIYRVARSEGFFSLWKGFSPFFMRLAPHTIICFLFFEALSKFYVKHWVKTPKDE